MATQEEMDQIRRLGISPHLYPYAIISEKSGRVIGYRPHPPLPDLIRESLMADGLIQRE